MRQLLLFLSLTLLTTSIHAATPPRKPNVLFLLVDDLGWTDLGCFGSDLYETPNIDRLAAKGMVFSSAYAACTVCSPTRAAVLTGKYPARLRVTDFIPGHGIQNTPLKTPDWTHKLEHRHVTIAEALKPAGYKTAHIGKWHLTPRDNKPQPEFWPQTQGFDINIGGFQAGAPGSYFWPYGRGKAKQQGRVINLPPGGATGEYLTERLTDEALKILDQWKDAPFFIYFAYYTVHTPLEARKAAVEHHQKKIKPGMRHTNPVYAAMVHCLDESVGRLLQKLDELGVADDTIIVFTSDNGGLTNNPGNPARVTSNLPLRNGKGSIYEGGVRVPGIIHWPGTTKAGSASKEPIISMDYYPTILEMTGVEGDARHNRKLDGVSLVPLLKNPSTSLGRESIFWHYPHYHMCGSVPHSVIRRGDWKLIVLHQGNRTELYNLARDIHENENLTESHPERAAKLHEELKEWLQHVDAQMPTPNPTYDPKQTTGWKRNGRTRTPEPLRRNTTLKED